MRDNLALFWFRYKYVVVAAIVLAVAGGGFLVGRTRTSDTPAGSSSTVIAPGGDGSTLSLANPLVVETLSEGDSALAACLTDHAPQTNERGSCISGLVPAGPLLLTEDDGGVSYLTADLAVATGDSTQDAPDVTGVDPQDLERVSAGIVTDLDNDGFDELVLGVAESGDEPGRILVLSRDENGDLYDTSAARIGETERFAAITRIEGFVAADWNRDGWIDLVFHRSSGGPDGAVGLLMNRGLLEPGFLYEPTTNSFPAGDDYSYFRSAMRGIFASVSGFDGRAGFTAVTAADLDNDGYQDLVLLTRIGILAVVWGGEDFEPRPTVLTVPAGGVDVLVTDIDRDNRRDIVVASAGASGLEGAGCPNNRPCDLSGGVGSGGVVVLLGRDGRDFTEDSDLTIGDVDHVTSVAAVDIGNDGWLDLAVGREPSSAGVELLDRDGLRLFSPVSSNGLDLDGFSEVDLGDVTIAAVSRIAVADINADGTEDILLAGRGTTQRQLVTITGDDTGDHLAVVVRGAASITATGTAAAGNGAQLTITDGSQSRRIEIGGERNPSVRGTSPIHVGLGPTDGTIDSVLVTFPASGRQVLLTDVPVNQAIEVLEPAS